MRKKIGILIFSLIVGVALVNATPRPAPASEADKVQFLEDAKRGDVARLREALQKGMDPNVRNDEGFTPLIYAAYYDHGAAVELLLAAGADPCARDNRGNDARMGVIFKGFDALFEKLLPLCDVNAVNREGQTALMFASLFGREGMARALIGAGARVDQVDLSGRDARSLAKGQFNQAMVEVLKITGVIGR